MRIDKEFLVKMITYCRKLLKDTEALEEVLDTYFEDRWIDSIDNILNELHTLTKREWTDDIWDDIYSVKEDIDIEGLVDRIMELKVEE